MGLVALGQLIPSESAASTLGISCVACSLHTICRRIEREIATFCRLWVDTLQRRSPCTVARQLWAHASAGKARASKPGGYSRQYLSLGAILR
jgi:hypothetical protein